MGTAPSVAYRFGAIDLKWRITQVNTRVSVLSDEPVRVNVYADSAGMPYNPSGATVQMAFIATDANPTSGDWKTGTWDVTAVGSYTAQVKSGATGAQLVVGQYTLWVKITDAAAGETPVQPVGQVIVQ